MYKLEWEGTYGYGDILGAYCHAGRLQNKLNESIDLTFRWYADREWIPKENKYHDDDPETVLERVELVSKHVDYENVITQHVEYPRHTGIPAERIRYVNRQDIDDWWSTTWKMKEEPRDDGHVAIWMPKTNKTRFNRHIVRHWKEPIKDSTLDSYHNYLRKEGKKLIQIDYRMPVDEVFDIIRTASYCIGHDGIGNVISKNYFKPIVVFSKQISFSKTIAGPWAYVTRSMTNDLWNVDELIDTQKEIIDEYRSTIY
jgi:hypothetical protein